MMGMARKPVDYFRVDGGATLTQAYHSISGEALATLPSYEAGSCRVLISVYKP